MADIDNDGDLDLLVGDSNGYITIYIRDDEGALSSSGRVRVDGEILNVHDRAACETVDWDLDGDLDLLVGSMYGTIILIINQGSAEEYDFTASGTIAADGEEIWLGSETAPAFGDLDEDGKRDLIIGSIYGELWFYPNIGEDDDPEFGEGVALQDQDGQISLDNYTRPEFVDWDGDGDLDMVVGMIAPQVNLYINPGVNSVSDHPVAQPDRFAILANYPEPFNHHTTLVFQNQIPQLITLDLTDITGRSLMSYSLGQLSGGEHRLNVDLNGLPDGRYFVKLNSAYGSVARSITLIR